MTETVRVYVPRITYRHPGMPAPELQRIRRRSAHYLPLRRPY